ncbi:glucose-6-phosphate isomerase [Flavobacteriales bacterium 34_180_T64]|nr:glucose-6-phosphate isomerase [Flavobacteriales bacterium 34_180_T64]
MPLKKTNPVTTKAWKKLAEHFNLIKDVHMKDSFAQNPNRAEELSIKWEDFYVDYSKHRITNETIELLLELAEEVDLKDAISKYFDGDNINETENRAVLHTALRAPKDSQVYVEGKNVIPEIHEVKKKIEVFSQSVESGNLRGYSNKVFTDIVNIGIGGSDLGPSMVVEALSYYKNHLNTHFISNVDGDHLHEIIKKLNPETTLFVIVSKTFTTQETMSNANTIRAWFLNTSDVEAIPKHFVAVSTNLEKAKSFGIHEENVFPMWNWVGGRFSLWSAVGLSISLSVGHDNFERLLEGAHEMDLHFKDEAFHNNMPVITALLSVWYNNFFKSETEVVIPYSQYLNQFATFLQQATMESNGKSIDRNGDPIAYQTGTIVWGEPGTNSQHAFFQLIHQGTKLIPAEFIGFSKSLHGNKEHHDKLMSNFFAQTEALLHGKSRDQVVREGKGENLINYMIFSGNNPTTTILINQLSPESLGKLIALYEHKIFVQGVVWNIFSFDQFGVELGKQLANSTLEEVSANANYEHDSSTSALLHHYKQSR